MTTSFVEIGRDTFGIIFTDDTQTEASGNIKRVLKRTIQPKVDPRDWLEQEAVQHEAISAALARINADEYLNLLSLPCVPRFYGVISSGFSWWTTYGNTHRWFTHVKGDDYHGIDCRYTCPSPLMSAQQIPSVSRKTAMSILAKYPHADDQAANVVRSEVSCDISILLRVYFGQSAPAHSNGTTSLHNFPLYCDRLTAVLSNADRIKVLEVMATALAFLHWHVKCDAKDVEFVLGGPNPLAQEQNCPTFELFGEKLHMWLLDFNQVETITMDVRGVEKAILGYENDPYYPKPDTNEADWLIFKNRYIAASQTIGKGGLLDVQYTSGDATLVDLPQLFITSIEEHNGLNRAQRALNLETAQSGSSYTLLIYSLAASTVQQMWTRLERYFKSS